MASSLVVLLALSLAACVSAAPFLHALEPRHLSRRSALVSTSPPPSKSHPPPSKSPPPSKKSPPPSRSPPPSLKRSPPPSTKPPPRVVTSPPPPISKEQLILDGIVAVLEHYKLTSFIPFLTQQSVKNVLFPLWAKAHAVHIFIPVLQAVPNWRNDKSHTRLMLQHISTRQDAYNYLSTFPGKTAPTLIAGSSLVNIASKGKPVILENTFYKVSKATVTHGNVFSNGAVNISFIDKPLLPNYGYAYAKLPPPPGK